MVNPESVWVARRRNVSSRVARSATSVFRTRPNPPRGWKYSWVNVAGARAERNAAPSTRILAGTSRVVDGRNANPDVAVNSHSRANVEPPASRCESVRVGESGRRVVSASIVTRTRSPPAMMSVNIAGSTRNVNANAWSVTTAAPGSNASTVAVAVATPFSLENDTEEPPPSPPPSWGRWAPLLTSSWGRWAPLLTSSRSSG